jgi:exodeoxyribonuclease VII small subunit
MTAEGWLTESLPMSLPSRASPVNDLATEDVKAMTFEAALTELEGIVARLEGGKAPLAESIAIYERGEALKSHCEELLKAAEARIEKITLRGGKPVGTEPLDQ